MCLFLSLPSFFSWTWINKTIADMSCNFSEPWLLTIGVLQVQCGPVGDDGLGRLAVCRGLLTCSLPPILLNSQMEGTQVNHAQTQKHVSVTFSCFYFWPSIASFISDMFTPWRFVSSGLCFVSAEAGLSLLSFWGWVMCSFFSLIWTATSSVQLLYCRRSE